ncbi:MAG: cobyrinate a,c-diamide synthase [Candidatus Omnitrophica bacterium]|nr:cobyrinate a,c-diamide synthase [Candidatus Omnitrophota bacterium]
MVKDKKNKYPRIVIAGTHSGVGKTTLTIGLLLAFKKKGIAVQPYKVGPDYIDSAFHSMIAGRACRNLDSFLLSEDVLLELFERQAQVSEFSIVEGVMGLYDGIGQQAQTGSTAHASKILKAPVVLIIDCGKMSGSAGAVALGYKKFDSKVRISGCILNKIASPSHYKIAKQSVEQKSGIEVLGYFPKNAPISMSERHLGLTPVQEVTNKRIYKKITKLVEQHIDIDRLITIAKSADALPCFRKTIYRKPLVKKEVSIAVARDKCFHFYYQDNLDILEHYGAWLKYFSPLKSKSLPKGVSGVYIGGGFPEKFAEELAGNKDLRADIKLKSRQGMPVYGECGGLMYLMRELQTADKKSFPMVGIFSGKTKMGKGLRMFGYYDVTCVQSNILCVKNSVTKGHVFHWSYLLQLPKNIPRVFKLQRRGKTSHDGYIKNNTLASYLHVHFGTNTDFASRFVEQCRDYKRKGVQSGNR